MKLLRLGGCAVGSKSVIMSLATGNFIKNNQNVLITGPSGVGYVK